MGRSKKKKEMIESKKKLKALVTQALKEFKNKKSHTS